MTGQRSVAVWLKIELKAQERTRTAQQRAGARNPFPAACGLSACAVERARLSPSGSAAGLGRAAPVTRILSPACAGERALLDPSGSAAGLGRAAAAQAQARDLQDARERIRGKTEKRVATHKLSTQTDESTYRWCPPRLRGACAFIHFLPAVLKSLFPPEPQVNSLSVFERRRKIATAFRTVSNRSLLHVVAQFGQHNGGLVRRNSLLRDPSYPGHFGQRG